ncbi:MAG TPA: VWA domain-containing protein [Ktedonobacteraceae bacterium]
MPVKIFFCYAHEDEALLKRLQAQLRPLRHSGRIEAWHDRDISAGTDWESEISIHLNQAQIILLLVSPDFINSDYCYGIEMQCALERHKQGLVKAIPVILRPSLWQETPLRDLQALPTDATPVISRQWHSLDEAFLDIADGIRKTVAQLALGNSNENQQIIDVPSPNKPAVINTIHEHQNVNQRKFPAQIEKAAVAAGLVLRCQLEKDFMLITQIRQKIYMLLEVEPTQSFPRMRMPLNFALVLDHSGSMKGAKLRNVKEAVKLVIDSLEPTDYISVVIFDDQSQVIIPSLPCNDKAGMKAAIDQILDAGGTTMSLGMINGFNELQRWNIPNAIKRMILLTDGLTYGDIDQCRQLAHDVAAAGIPIYTLGIGSDVDSDMLNDIAVVSGGEAEFIQNPVVVYNFFQQQVQSAMDVTIRNATLLLRLPTGVTPTRAVKVLPTITDFGPGVLSSDRQVTIPLGDLMKDQPLSIICELMVTSSRHAGLYRLAQTELTYDAPILGIVGNQIRLDSQIAFTTDANQSNMFNENVRNLVASVKDFS